MSYLLLITVLVAATLSTTEAGPIKKGKDGVKQNAREYKDMADYMDSFSPSSEIMKQVKYIYSEVSKPKNMIKTITDADLTEVRRRCDEALALIHEEYLKHNVEQQIDVLIRRERTRAPPADRPTGVVDCERKFLANMASALKRPRITRAIDLKAFFIILSKYFLGIKDATIVNKDISTLQGYQKMISNVNAAIRQDPVVKDAQDVSFSLKEMSNTLLKFLSLTRKVDE